MAGSFYGWYLKCQSDAQTLAVIPAVHGTRKERVSSIQVITESGAWSSEFPVDAFHREKGRIRIGENSFGENGIRLAVSAPDFAAEGELVFGPLAPLNYDIMGPFALVPFLECRHSVRSMRHAVRGELRVNGQSYAFEDGWGYWEGDQGRSFPTEYAWTQCCFPEGSLMLAVADIPMAGFRFTGIIGAVLWQGKTYRLATYLGAKAAQVKDGALRIVQGDLELEARLIESAGQRLRAPVMGGMNRTIHESAACRAYYRFRRKGAVLFELETALASFEYEYRE